MNNVAEIEVANPQIENGILDRAVCMTLELHKPGNHRRISPEAISDPEKAFDRSMIGVSKKIIECDEYDAIRRFDRDTKSWLFQRSLPCALTGRGGVYMIPKVILDEVYEWFERRLARREELVSAYIAVYPEKVAGMEAKLGATLFNAADYLSAERVRSQFGMDYQLMEFRSPSQVSGIRRDIFEKERRKMKEKWVAVTEDATATLRMLFAQMTTALMEKLADPDKQMKKGTFEKLDEFIARFPALNSVNNDAELALQVEAMRKLMGGVSPDEIKHYKDIRATVATGVEKIKTKLDTMIADRPARMLVLDDE